MVVVFDNFQDQIMMLDSPLGRVHGYIHEGHSQAEIPVSWLSGCLASMVFVQVFFYVFLESLLSMDKCSFSLQGCSIPYSSSEFQIASGKFSALMNS